MRRWRQAASRTERIVANVLAGVLVVGLYAWFAYTLIEDENGNETTRIISARYAERWEQRRYEEGR